MKLFSYPFTCLSLISFSLFAQERIDHAVISRIKEEGFQNSQVMETLSWLSDVYGPRLFASPGYLEAAEWAKHQMEKFGVQNVRLEPLEGNFRGWSAESFSIEMIEPRYTPLFTYPKSWTSGTNGDVTGEPFVMKLRFKDGLPQLDSLKAFHGKLAGRIVLWDRGRKPLNPNFQAFSNRFTDEELNGAQHQINPVPEEYIGFLNKKTLYDELNEAEKHKPKWGELAKFFIDEGARALILESDFDHGILHVDSYDLPFVKIGDIKAIPTFVISSEQFSRLVRMKAKGVSPTLKLHLESTFYEDKKYAVNILGEIPGNDQKLRNEIVMIGAHFDSWHAGTGATDNAAGSAVMMEAMRILKAVQLRPRRTIRIALWTGEEQGYFGSRDYVSRKQGDILTGEAKNNREKISGYFNFDNGSGRIRGVYLQGNESLRPILGALLEPFAYLGANTIVSQKTSWTDHVIFDAVNVPAVQFIQDPLNYMTVTHHTNLDVYEYVIEDDLKQSAVIIASLVYHIAMRDDMLPRKRLKQEKPASALTQ